MLVSIHQPHYLPWLRYFEKVARSEFFIVLDDVDFTRNGWQNRNRIKTRRGAHILTVPVHQHLGMPIREVAVSAEPWPRKHWLSLAQSYGPAPFLDAYRQALQGFYSRPWTSLVELNCAMFTWHMQALGLSTPWVLASSLASQGSSTRRLVELVRAVGGTGYLTGQHAFHEYLDPAVFRQAGVDLWVFEWQCPEYRQLHPAAGFLPDLAALDLLLCEGGEGSRQILAQGGKVSAYVG